MQEKSFKYFHKRKKPTFIDQYSDAKTLTAPCKQEKDLEIISENSAAKVLQKCVDCLKHT